MVKVTPHRYRTKSGLYEPVKCDFMTLDLYFVGDAGTGYRAFGESWVLDDEVDAAHRDWLPGGYYGTEVRADPDEVARWTAAQRSVETALRDAEAQLLRDIGLIGNRTESRRWLALIPGWRARARRWRPGAERRASAQFRQRFEAVKQTYEPVAKEIVARVLEAERLAHERWERAHAVAMQARWDYRVDRTSGTVHVFHRGDGDMDTRALAEKLLEIRRDTGVTRLRWDEHARAEIERGSGIDFQSWWRAVTPDPWTDSGTIPNTRLDHSGRTVHVSAHTSFGIGGHGVSGHF